MATTVTISLVNACAGGGHLTVNASVAGGAARQYAYTADELLDDLPEAVIRDTVLGLMRLHFKGRTKQQIRTELTAGVTLVI